MTRFSGRIFWPLLLALAILPRPSGAQTACVGGGCSGGGGGGFSGGTVGGSSIFTAQVTFGSAAAAANAIEFNETANRITFEGATADAFEARLGVVDPTVGDSVFLLPNLAGATTDTIAVLGLTQVFTARETFGSAADAANAIDITETAGRLTFEGATADAFETRFGVTDPTVGDGIILLPNLAAATTDTLMTRGITETITGAKTFTGGTTISASNFDVASSANFVFTSTQHVFRYATAYTPDSLGLGAGSLSNSFHIVEAGDITAFDFANGPAETATAVDPLLIVHSAVQDTTQYTAIAAWGVASKSVKTLTESAATSAVRIPVASGAGTGGTFMYCVFASDGTDHQERCSDIRFAVVNKAGTETCTLSPGTVTELLDANAAALSSSTLTYAITCLTSPTNAVDIQVNAVSGLTQTTLEVRYSVQLTGPGEPARQ